MWGKTAFLVTELLPGHSAIKSTVPQVEVASGLSHYANAAGKATRASVAKGLFAGIFLVTGATLVVTGALLVVTIRI